MTNPIVVSLLEIFEQNTFSVYNYANFKKFKFIITLGPNFLHFDHQLNIMAFEKNEKRILRIPFRYFYVKNFKNKNFRKPLKLENLAQMSAASFLDQKRLKKLFRNEKSYLK